MILVSSNEEWAKSKKAGEMIDTYHRTLAISFRKPVVRSSNGGPSSTFNTDGLKQGGLDYKEKGTLFLSVPTNAYMSVFNFTGDLLGLISLCILVFSLYFWLGKRQSLDNSK